MGSIHQVGAWDHHFIYLACHNYKSSFIPEYNLRPLPRFSLWPAGERVPWHLERENEVWWHSVGEGYVCVNCVDLVVNSPKAIWMECWYHISKRYSQRQRQNCMHTLPLFLQNLSRSSCFIPFSAQIACWGLLCLTLFSSSLAGTRHPVKRKLGCQPNLNHLIFSGVSPRPIVQLDWIEWSLEAG